MNKELEEAKQNLIKQLENTRIANECGLATKGKFRKDIKAIETILNYIDNSISKEVIKEKIEELNKDIEDYLKTDKSGRFTRTNCIFTYKKEALQELLEGK